VIDKMTLLNHRSYGKTVIKRENSSPLIRIDSSDGGRCAYDGSFTKFLANPTRVNRS
jgi:hypothetical protein